MIRSNGALDGDNMLEQWDARYLRRHPCLDPESWTVCRCGCWGSPQHCPGRCPDAGGSPHSLAPDGSCCTERRPFFPSSPPAPPTACNPPVFLNCRCLPGQASILHQCCQSRSESKEDQKEGCRKITENNAHCLLCGYPGSLETWELFRSFVRDFGIVNRMNENFLFDDASELQKEKALRQKSETLSFTFFWTMCCWACAGKISIYLLHAGSSLKPHRSLGSTGMDACIE